jgi:hypothetical protein
MRGAAPVLPHEVYRSFSINFESLSVKFSVAFLLITSLTADMTHPEIFEMTFDYLNPPERHC